jgi:hypothetical protein
MATASDFLVERLTQWGVQRIYGYRGDGISGITTALRKAGDKPRFVQARHLAVTGNGRVGRALPVRPLSVGTSCHFDNPSAVWAALLDSRTFGDRSVPSRFSIKRAMGVEPTTASLEG